MSIKLKVGLIFLSVILSVELVEIWIQGLVVLPSFGKMERAEAAKDIRRTVLAIDRELHHLDSLCHTWSAWDETCKFLENEGDEYIEANLSTRAFASNNLHAIVFLDVHGRVKWRRILDPETLGMTDAKELPEGIFGPDHALMNFGPESGDLAKMSVTGIMNTEKGPMLAASRPILTSRHEGPVKGAVIMGRFFTRELREKLALQTQVNFNLIPMQTGKIPGRLKTIAKRADKEIVFQTPSVSNDPIKAAAVYAGIGDDPGILIEASIPRDIWTRGLLTVRYVLVSNLVVGTFVFIVISVLLTWTVLNPLRKLMFHTQKIRKTRDLSLRLNLDGGDEIGILAKEFDAMLSELSVARKKLLEQHYFSGMAAMAAGAIHNIRNQLQPVLGQLQIVRERLSFRAQNADDLVPRLDTVLEQIYQMENILNEHESWARREKTVEKLDLQGVLRDALDSMDQRLREIIVVKTKAGFEKVKDFTANRMTLLQIFTVLLTNAAESFLRGGNGSGTVTVDASTEKKDGRRIFWVELCDNGQGITDQQLPHVFERSFSVKPEGGSGIGLHWCANAMSSMNGGIRIASGGEGKGLCVRLEWLDNFACIETEKELES